MENGNKSLVNRLSIVAFTLLGFAVSCTSPAEKYIQNEFATTVRLDAIEQEIEGEVANIVTSLNEMAEEANPDAKESKRLAQSYEKAKRDIESRLNKYNRTGDYGYIVGIYNDAEKAEANLAKSQRLKKKAQPYINHTKKQVDALVKALNAVDGEELLLSTTLVKNNEVSIDSIFTNIIGTPEALANPTEEEIERVALTVLTNYFVENPTPVVKAYEFNKSDDQWYVMLSNDAEYFVRAIECSNGEYEYRYSKAESNFTPSGKSRSKRNSNSGSADFDEFLDDYESFVTKYVKEYKSLQDKVSNGDFSAMSDLSELAEEAKEFTDEYENWDGNISSKQANRYLKITQKLTSMLE